MQPSRSYQPTASGSSFCTYPPTRPTARASTQTNTSSRTRTQLPQDRTIDGKSILSLLRKGKAEPDETLHNYYFSQWNRVHPNPDESWSVHHGSYKLVNGELFDMEKDPGEQKNLAKVQPQ